MVETKFRHALISRYQKLLKQKGITDPINRYAEQWTANDLIESYGLDTCYEMLAYYFEVSERPSWKWFSNNAEKVYKNLMAKQEDARIRELMRAKAKEWLEK